MPLMSYNASTGVETPLVTSYSTIDKKSWVYQPNFTRWRHASKSPRSSLRVNQELTQTYYDLYVLLRRIGILDSNIQYVVDSIEDGGDITGVEYNWMGDEDSMVLSGVEDLSAEIDALRKRVEMLEG